RLAPEGDYTVLLGAATPGGIPAGVLKNTQQHWLGVRPSGQSEKRVLIPANRKLQRKAGMEVIQHVVFLIKENRTFDNYFGAYPGADGASSGVISNSQVVPLTHDQPDLTYPYDPEHGF